MNRKQNGRSHTTHPPGEASGPSTAGDRPLPEGTRVRAQTSRRPSLHDLAAAEPTAARKRASEVGIGSILHNRFVLEQLIARGGMGVVYRARDLRREEASDRDPYVAIKVLREDFKRHADSLIALERETRKAQRLAHPNIGTVHDFDRDGETVFMTMELLVGESLQERLKRMYPRPVPLQEAIAIIQGMSEALGYAHKHGIVHSDLKPGNVFITSGGVVKILDFGIARAARRPDQPAQNMTIFDPGTLGALTPAYASCEMLEEADPDPRDDIYALACVSYELLTGRHPFNKSPCNQARDNQVRVKAPSCLSRAQWHGLRRGLAFDREDRTPTVVEFVRDITQPAVGREKTTKRWFWGLSAMALMIAVTIGVFTAGVWRQEAPYPLEPEPKPMPTQPRELTPELQAKVNDMLEVADVHLLVGRLVDPPGSNAFESYREVLEKNPGNPRAIAGLENIADRYLEMAQDRIRQGDRKKALDHIRTGLKVRPNHPGLLALQQDNR